MDAMEIIGLDLHKRESQLCIKSAAGTISERRIGTSRDWFTAVLGGRARARVLLEATTESEWVARHLEALGHEVIVADPNYAPMYAHRSRRSKTDKRDARTLMRACETGVYRPAHRLSEARRHVRADLAVRDALVRTRTRYVSLAKSLVRRDGLRVASSRSDWVVERIAALPLGPELTRELAPLFHVLGALSAPLEGLDCRLAELTRTDPAAALLATAPGVGPVTASAFVATIDDVRRFRGAHELEAYLGLVPREKSSGEKRQLGRITKAGNKRVRWLLVEAGWSILRSKAPETAALRAWALRIAARRGKRIAAVALARRLAGILFAMWRDGVPYDARKIRLPQDSPPGGAISAGTAGGTPGRGR
jgi:transposase